MSFERWYKVVKNCFRDEQVDVIRALKNKSILKKAEIAADLENYRNAKGFLVPPTKNLRWIHDGIIDVVQTLNREYWKLHLDKLEVVQFLSYGVGQHYDWHPDAEPTPYPTNSLNPGKVRKMTFVLMLSDPEDFDGGDFEIEMLAGGPNMPERRYRKPLKEAGKGTAIVFPSSLYHKVHPVTAGERDSLVAWCLGPPIK